MQGHSDDEADEILLDDQQAREPIALPVNEPLAEAEQQQEQLMKISAAVYNGYPTASTISLLLSFPKTTAIALADTGSTTTFMDLDFAVKHKIPMTNTSAKSVTVAGGGTLTSSALAPNCRFTIQGQEFVTSFRILPLQGSEIIFGVDWFKQHNPVTFDFVGRKLTVERQGKVHTFHDHLLPKGKLLISSDQCSKLIEKGAMGYMLYSPPETDKDSEEGIPVPDAITHILHQFQDIFQPPSGLPPIRSCDHQIPLLPNAKPPNIRPYRMSHS
jgi:hypothetical protein